MPKGFMTCGQQQARFRAACQARPGYRRPAAKLYTRLTLFRVTHTVRLQDRRLTQYQPNLPMLSAQSLLKIFILGAWLLTLGTIAFGAGSAFHAARSARVASHSHNVRIVRTHPAFGHARASGHGPGAAHV